MITASQQIDRVANALNSLAQSRAVSARDIKPLLLRLDRVANTLDQKKKSRKTSVDWIDIKNAADDFIRTGKSPEEVTVVDVARALHLSHDEAQRALGHIVEKMRSSMREGDLRDRDPQPNQMLGFRQTSVIKKRADSDPRFLTNRPMMELYFHVQNNPDIRELYSDLVDIIWHPGDKVRGDFKSPEAQSLLEELSSLTGVTKVDVMRSVRRDPSGSEQFIGDLGRPNVMNSRKTPYKKINASLKDIESELDQLGYQYSVHPGRGVNGTSYFVYKNQKDHLKEQKELNTLAEKYSGSFYNPPRSLFYKISVTSEE